MKSSQTALDLIWNEEAGDPAYYVKHECDWPGGASGVTIGGFYDCGYVSADEMRRDWGDKLSPDIIDDLETVIGIHGSPARSHARELAQTVKVPIDVAKDVFLTREIPKWEAVVNKLPNADKLSEDSFGALVSLAMNRGDGFNATGPRYAEMRLIKSDMAGGYFQGVPALFLKMRRLWPKGGDLWNRRTHEAELFEKGLT